MPVITPLRGCDLNAIKAAASCFMPQCLGMRDMLAMDVYIRTQAAYAEDPAKDYRNLTTLDTAAALWATLSESERKAICLWIDLQNALYEGATFGGEYSPTNPPPISVLMNGIKCFSCVGTDRLKGMALFMKCILTAEEAVE